MTTTQEPKAFAAISDLSLPPGVEDFTGLEHPWGGRCKVCDRELLAPLWRQIPGCEGWYPVNCCDACYDTAKAPGASRGEFEWQTKCPIEFKQAWDGSKGDDGAMRKACYFDPAQRKGMVLHGLSGTGKTRIMWIVAKKVAESGRSWLWIDSLDYVDALPKEALFVDVLFLDDFGNEPLQGQAETRLLKLIRSRCDHHRPIVLTTQHQGDSLSKRFREGASAQGVVRRLREFCDAVYVRGHA